jgi:hypothetical protein
MTTKNVMVEVNVKNLIFYSVEIYPNFGLVKKKNKKKKKKKENSKIK